MDSDSVFFRWNTVHTNGWWGVVVSINYSGGVGLVGGSDAVC